MGRLSGIIMVPPEQLLYFAFSLLLAIFLGLWIASIYRFTHRGMNYESSFLSTLVLLTPIVTLVMFFIRGDLVLSLGLVGSLSIIRFRTPIKDTRDMVFLFWSIVTGLGCGTLNWTYVVLAAVVLSLLLSLFYLIRYGRQLHNEYILILAGNSPYDFFRIDDIVHKPGINVQLRNHEIDGDSWELTYEFRFEHHLEDRIQGIVSEVRNEKGIQKVSLLTPQLTLPM
jgi:hypothetical protein